MHETDVRTRFTSLDAEKFFFSRLTELPLAGRDGGDGCVMQTLTAVRVKVEILSIALNYLVCRL